MKREGRQHGMVRSSSVLPAELNARRRVVNSLSSPPTSGFFAKVPAKPTNHSKYTTRCRKARCKDCHHSPVSKSRDKAKGAHKLRSGDVVLNHRLVSWRVVVDGGSLPNCKAISASEMLNHLYAKSLYGEEEYDDYDDQNMEEEVDYGNGEPNNYLEVVDVEEGCSGAKDEEMESSGESDEEERDMGFYVVGVSWDYADGEDWLVVKEM